MVNEGDGSGRDGAGVRSLRALFLDDDTGRLTVDALPLAPSIVVQSRAGIHVYYRLRPGEPLDAFTPAQAALARAMGTDPSITDLPRVMRLPGFPNQKDHPAAPFQVRVVQTSGAVYTITEVLAAFGADDRPAPSSFPLERRPFTSSANVLVRARAYLEKMPPAIQGEHGDARTFRAAAVLVRDLGLSDDDALALLGEWNARCVPPWTEDDLRVKLARARKYGRRSPGGVH